MHSQVIAADQEAAFRDEERRARQAGSTFAEACRTGNIEAMLCAADQVNCEMFAWPYAFRALKHPVAPEIARAFLAIWVENKSIALQFSRRPDILRGLRWLFPTYAGGPVTLYRGERARRYRSRMWGVSWTSDLAVAEHFATDHFRRYAPGGAVIIETVAPAAAIVAELEQHYEEREFIVDPRHLDRVRVVKRFDEVPVNHRREE